MTHWVNPDVVMSLSAVSPTTNPPVLTMSVGSGSLDQYGMEYNPVAINETLAYTFQSKVTGTAQTVSRFFIELVNTLPAAFNTGYDYVNTPANNYYGNASAINLGGFNYTLGDPYAGGCWDLVFTSDTPLNRPDPYRGEIVNNTVSAGGVYALIPLNRDSFGPSPPAVATAVGANPAAINQGDVTLLPVNPAATTPTVTPVTATAPPAGAPPINYFYVIGDPASPTNTESNPPTTGTNSPGAASVTQNLQTGYDPAPGINPPMITPPPPFKWHPGILPGTAAQTGPPPCYQANLPPPATNQSQFYWVCLRRPANPFAPVSATNPMCVVDSMRFNYIDGTGSMQTTDPSTTPPTPMTSGSYNTIYSTQRLQPYRGGHAVCSPNATAGTGVTPNATNQPPDPRYGYIEQVAVPGTTLASRGGLNNFGVYGVVLNGSGAVTNQNPATNYIYNTLGAPNDSAENWDYFVFNDRDFTSIAELTLVPGCPPGLFTKQFCEFAPSLSSAAAIFAMVNPVVTTATNPSYPAVTGSAPTTPNPIPPTSANALGGNTAVAPITPFVSATVPFLLVSNVTTNPTGQTVPPITLGASPYSQPTTVTMPVQPHSFPYLVDKFFYSGASNFLYPPTGIGTDPSNLTTATPAGNGIAVVGGPASDGWFKMFDFVEVPSQMIGSIGPVAQGFNFDWARQDSKPGLLNINLIIDEEAFFSVFGRQDTSLDQTLLNSIELPLLANVNNGVYSLPYSMPLSTNSSTTPPIPAFAPPVPLVVTATTYSGAPNYVYPVTDQLQYVQHGFTESYDPIQTAINTAAGAATTPPPTGNRIKAAFAQFLWLRHGGSGYMFGFGNGGVGQNSAVVTPALSAGTAPVGYAGALPSERYFHALSYPDIDYTILRPAALPPSTVSLPAMVPETTSTFPAVVANAQSLLYQPTFMNLPTTAWYFSNGVPTAMNIPTFYGPYVPENTNFGAGVPVVYSGDPGVRNPLLSVGYASSGGTSPYGVYPTQATNTVPLGIPLPVNVAFPTGPSPAIPSMDAVVMPPAIPPRRLFQPPDAYGSGAPVITSGNPLITNAYNGTTILPPAMSNASDSGDPWINNQIPNNPTGDLPSQAVTVTAPVYVYTLNNGFSNLTWSGGTVYPTTPATAAPLPATGALPLVSTAYPPYGGQLAALTVPGNLKYTSNAATAPNSTGRVYLGTASTGVANTDDRQHPYFRSEMLQKAMNLTTVRTHQYAVWITIGFFEISKQGDINMLGQGNPIGAYDVIGSEVGAVTGKGVRYRGFFLVDRTKLFGFNPYNTGSFRSAVVYRKVIQ